MKIYTSTGTITFTSKEDFNEYLRMIQYSINMGARRSAQIVLEDTSNVPAPTKKDIQANNNNK
jgi:hypothetical protein